MRIGDVVQRLPNGATIERKRNRSVKKTKQPIYECGVGMKAISLVAAISGLLLFGCASSRTTGGVVPGQSAAQMPSGTSVRGARVLLMPIADGGNTEDGIAPGSGAGMTASLRDTIIARGMSPLVADTSNLKAAFEEARSEGYDFVIKAVFTDWQDNATAWSGRPDHAGVSAELYDARTSTLLAAVTHREKGSSMSLISQTPSRFYPLISNAVLAKFIPAIATHMGSSE